MPSTREKKIDCERAGLGLYGADGEPSGEPAAPPPGPSRSARDLSEEQLETAIADVRLRRALSGLDEQQRLALADGLLEQLGGEHGQQSAAPGDYASPRGAAEARGLRGADEWVVAKAPADANPAEGESDRSDRLPTEAGKGQRRHGPCGGTVLSLETARDTSRSRESQFCRDESGWLSSAVRSHDSAMLEQLGVPDSFEGLVGIQIFKTRRWHLEPAIFQVAGPSLDGACLRVGELEDAYLQARALDAAWRKHILLLTVGAAKSLDAHLAEEMNEVRTDQTLQSRAFATLVGWRTESLPYASEADDPAWASDEHARGVRLRTELHLAIGRLGAVLAVGLRDVILDRVAQHSFWVTPSRDPTIVLGEFSASADLSAPSSLPFPRWEVENWLRSISSSPPWLYETLAEPLELIAAAKATEGTWVRLPSDGLR